MPVPSRDERCSLLSADCANCFGLCCVALSFARSADFAVDKPAGEPCVNLREDFACSIHQHLRPSGFRGCTVFDCSGAGQKVSRDMYAGVSWRDDPDTRAEMFAVFPVVRDLHEMLWYLAEASDLDLDAALHRDVDAAFEALQRLTDGAPERLLELDVDAERAGVGGLLGRVSEHVRGRVGAALVKSVAVGEPVAPVAPVAQPTSAAPSVSRRIGPRADLAGASLAGRNLRGANLRGALLIAADLRGADLTSADLLGADLRDARLDGAHIEQALFVTQRQLNAARGDAATALPTWAERPGHWV